MTIIVVDACILAKSPRLRNKAWQSLVDHRADWGLQLVVPEVALLETVNVVRRVWQSELDKVDALKVGEFDLHEDQATMRARIREQIDSYEETLRERIANIGATVALPPSIDATAMVRRAIAGRAPFANQSKDCFRDSVIWLTVIDIALANPDQEVWFVSENHRDFGPANPKVDECPLAFHRDLRAELDEKGLSERVFYVASADRIDQHLAAQFAPVDPAEVRRQIDELGFETLTEVFERESRGIQLDPQKAALDPSAMSGLVTTARPVVDTWQFYEGARLKEGGWTSRFVVTASTVYVRTNRDDDLAVDQKDLAFSGALTLDSKGEVTLTLSSATALPDDPMRQLWPDPEAARRDQIHRDQISQQIRQLLNDAGPFDNKSRLWAEVQRLMSQMPTSEAKADIVKRTADEFIQTPAAQKAIDRVATEIVHSPVGREAIRRAAADMVLQGRADTDEITRRATEAMMQMPAAQAEIRRTTDMLLGRSEDGGASLTGDSQPQLGGAARG
ncbi:PIN domain-containing protein [Nocardia sputi]|uniref:PIN domain-containing protein n=1 Tax=Nocardia sputi TaxID=2943705 RepID=UPI0020C052B4|nr:PIN domain-containing protein [Nocardia sputi]